MPMNEKRARFCEEYLVDLNATQAAIRAGYSKKSAYSQGHELLKNPEVQERVAELKAARAERVQVDADWVLERLVEIFGVRIGDLYDERGNLKPVSEWPESAHLAVTGIDTLEEREQGVLVGHTRKMRMESKLRALEMIGKHVNVQAWRDRLEVNDGNPVNIVVQMGIEAPPPGSES